MSAIADEVLRRGKFVRVLYHPEPALTRRDLAFALHELSFHETLTPAVDGDLFLLPYWDYLETQTTDPAHAAFLRQGSLTLILSLALQNLAALGRWFEDPQHPNRLRLCRDAVEALETQAWLYDDPELTRLAAATSAALTQLATNTSPPLDLDAEADWAHRRYVLQYLAERGTRPPQ